jgi:hypothetical protein
VVVTLSIVFVATAVGAALVVSTRRNADIPRTHPPPPTTTQPSPNSDPAVVACRDAVRELKGFQREAEAAYEPAGELPDNTPEAKRTHVYRDIGASLYAIEVQLDAVHVPDALTTVYELERRFVKSARTAFERAAEAVQTSAGSDADAEIQTLVARGNELHDVADKQLSTFKPKICAS